MRPTGTLRDVISASLAISSLTGADRKRWESLQNALVEVGPVVVAFSGGADSALLAWAAHQVHGVEGCLVATAVSPSLANGELEDCRRLASSWGLDWRALKTTELQDPRYVANDSDRCYWCKTALFDVLEPLAKDRDATVALGVNADDLGDHRPGQRAASEREGRFPLLEAGLSKADVRSLSRALGLETADKPAAACLASRVPYGTAVTIGVLSEVEAAERSLRALGFEQLRVRYHRDVARLEVPLEQLTEVLAQREDVVSAVLGAGFRYVALDLEGFRSGSLNRVLTESEPNGI